jgi:hypothetical protein
VCYLHGDQPPPLCWLRLMGQWGRASNGHETREAGREITTPAHQGWDGSPCERMTR